ncbi:MAG: ORF6N domain-containing protein [Selenomonadaceae bacterium]|nr:ORF6N domain-containing protein [Selenomonadaceae bacterium]
MDIQTLVPVDYSNQRVLLTAQLAKVYGTTPAHIKDNFRYAKKHFIEGEHYFKVTGEALRALKGKLSEGGNSTFVSPIPKTANALLLWTYQGCIRHCKMLNTQEAWDMFNELERVYFGVLKGEVAQPELPSSKEFKAFKKNQPAFTTGEHDAELARELITLADKITDSPTKDKILIHAANLLVGKNIF